MAETQPQYSPIPKGQQEMINEMWNIYRTDVGLWGDIYLQFREQGMQEQKIPGMVSEYRKATKGNLDAWHKLREGN
jgi:hypothetical protein